MAHDAFLLMEGITGGCADPGHEDWIRVHFFSHHVSQPELDAASRPGDAGAGRAEHGDFVVIKTVDRASPDLSYYCCSGQRIPKVVLELCDSSNYRMKYMEYVMRDVLIKGFRPFLERLAGTTEAHETMTREEIALRYRRIDWIFTLNTGVGPQGSIQHFWDLNQNRGG